MDILLSVESEKTIKEMGACCVNGRVRVDLQTGEQDVIVKDKTYWFMPHVFEETNDPQKYLVHELPESIVKQIVEFIRQ